MRKMAFVLCFAVAGVALASAQAARGSGTAKPAATPAGPVMIVETVKGTIEIQLFPKDAPKSVEHTVALANRGFYRSQRFHRVEASVVQFGDQLSRDMTQERYWGNGTSNNPIGVAEISKRAFVRGVVALAHAGNPSRADSQLFILKTANSALAGKYTIVGQVTKGMDVVDKLQKADQIKNVTIKQ